MNLPTIEEVSGSCNGRCIEEHNQVAEEDGEEEDETGIDDSLSERMPNNDSLADSQDLSAIMTPDMSGLGIHRPHYRDIFKRFFPFSILAELKALYVLAIAVSLMGFGQILLIMECNIFCSYLGKDIFAAVGLANSVLYSSGIYLGIGLCTACDTLFSQLYGNQNRHRMGIILQRSVMIISLVYLLCSTYMLNLEILLRLLGQDADIAKIAANYVMWFYPGLWFNFNALILSRYLQTQDRLIIPIVAIFTANLVNIFLHYIFIFLMGFGYRSSALAFALSNVVEFFIEFIYAFCFRLNRETWRGFKKEAMLDWRTFSRLAFSGVCHVLMEVLCWELMVIISGNFGMAKLAAMSISCNLESFLYCIPFGFGVALSIRIGQALGAGKPDAAKHAFWVAIMNMMITSALLTIVAHYLLCMLAGIYTSDLEILQLFKQIKPYVVMALVLDAFTILSSGTLRGCGLQMQGAFTVIFGYNCIGIPLFFVFSIILNMQLVGLWFGLDLCLVIMSIVFVGLLGLLSWEHQAINSHLRMVNTMNSVEFEQTHHQPTESTPFLRPRIGVQQTAGTLGVIREAIQLSHEPNMHTGSIYAYSTCNNSIARSAFIPVHGFFATESPPQPMRFSRRKFKKIVIMRIITLVLCLAVLVASIATSICLTPKISAWFPTNDTVGYNHSSSFQ